MRDINLTARTITRAYLLCVQHQALSESSDFDTVAGMLYTYDRAAYNYMMATDDFDLIGETVFILYFGETTIEDGLTDPFEAFEDVE